jgi:hypothetical protein
MSNGCVAVLRGYAYCSNWRIQSTAITLLPANCQRTGISSITDAIPWGYLAAAVVVLLVGLGVALFGVLAFLSALIGGATLLALFEAVLPYLAALVKVARAVSLEDIDSDRMQSVARQAQRRLSV